MPPRKLFIPLLLILFSPGWAGNGVSWQPWSEMAFEKARTMDKLVLVDLSAEWCAFCKKMDATTWKDPEVLAVIEKNFVPVKIVDEKDPQLAERYRQYGRPAIIIMDADGKELIRKRGYLKPQWMSWMLQAVVQEHQQGDGS